MDINVEIRQASMDDLDAVTAVERACFPEAEAADRESMEKRLALFGPSFMVVVNKENNTIIGLINGTVSNADTISDEMYEDIKYDVRADYQMIFGLDVLPEYRCRGIAEMLMNAMIKLAWDEGRRGLVLTCKEGLIGYYEKFGYVNKGVSKSVHGGALWYDMVLTF